jgi:DNA repair photolyase
MPGRYTTPLSLTSQFFFCGLPLRLDSYRGCGFQCSFCYARYRGGNVPGAAVFPADPHTLRRILARALNRDRAVPASTIGQFLRQKVPIHFGGMSDPFQHAERVHKITRHFLEALLEFQYPTVISTRSTMVATSPYLELLRAMKSVVVQFSFTSIVEKTSQALEPHTPKPADLLRTMEQLANQGIVVTCRWQPYVPGLSESPPKFVRAVAAAGARHVAIEHLKLPVERNHFLWTDLAAARPSLWDDYRKAGAKLDGREFLLPAEIKLPTILETRDAVRKTGMSLGVADNDLQYLSDSSCCCSGVDRFPGFEGWFKHQVAHAVRRCRTSDKVTYGSIAHHWTPQGSVDRWLNSHSRIGRNRGSSGSLAEHIRVRWNNPGSSFSPAAFYGVEPCEELTAAGFRVFRWRDDARRLVESCPAIT